MRKGTASHWSGLPHTAIRTLAPSLATRRASLTAEPRSDGGTHVYHILYIDLPVEYLPIFGSLRGFDLEFETFHIYEEARGFNQLLRADAFTEQDKTFLFDGNNALARDWPLPAGRPWPRETLTLRPNRVMTYEEMVVELSQIMADVIPSSAFMRQYRHLAVTRRYNAMEVQHDHT